MTAIRATFSDFRTVKSRKIAQLVMEVPIEEADAALRSLGGVPRPDVDRWVAIAPLTEEAAKRPPREPKSWTELSYAAQAGIRCNDPKFQAWLNEPDADRAAAAVRRICGVISRTEFDKDIEAGKHWHDLDDAFLRYSRDEAPA